MEAVEGEVVREEGVEEGVEEEVGNAPVKSTKHCENQRTEEGTKTRGKKHPAFFLQKKEIEERTCESRAKEKKLSSLSFLSLSLCLSLSLSRRRTLFASAPLLELSGIETHQSLFF